MVAKHRERSILRRPYSANWKAKPSPSYEQLTELLADVDNDIFRPGAELATTRGTLLLTVHMAVYLMVVMVVVLLATVTSTISGKKRPRKYTQRKPKEDPAAPPCPDCPYGHGRKKRSGDKLSTRLLVAHVTRTRRTVVQGANHRRHRRRTVLPSPLSSKTLARLRAPFAGLAVTSSHPDRTMPGVRHGDTRGAATSIRQTIRPPRRTWPGGRMPGVAAGC